MLDDINWTTHDEIEKDIINVIPSKFLKDVTIDEYPNPGNFYDFYVIIKLKWWTWLALGLLHKRYYSILKKHCDIGKPAGIIGEIIVK